MTGADFGGRERTWGTFGCRRQVLMVARTQTSTIRLLEAARLFRGDFRVRVVFTVHETSEFSRGVRELLRDAGEHDIVEWEDVRRQRIDYALAVSASENIDFHPLRARTVVLPHGIGFNKYVPTRNSTRLAGLPPRRVLRRGKVRLVLAHPDQEQQLRAACPEVAGRTAVVGDPTFDELIASAPLRDFYRRRLGIGRSGSGGNRKLVLITSTWREESQLGRWAELPKQLLVQLPADEYQVAAVLHPNIWSWYGSRQVRSWLEPALEAGLLLPPPQRGWQALLVASDLVLGDHGSVTLYAAALGKPLLLTAPAEETVPGTPVAELTARARRLDRWSGLREQVEDALSGGAELDSFAEGVFSNAGNSKRALRDLLYAELDLQPPDVDPPPRRPLEPEPEHQSPTSCDVLTEWLSPTEVGIMRFPRIRGETPPEGTRHLAVEESEPDLRLPQNAAVLTRRAPASPAEALEWARETLTQHPGARLVASATVDGSRALLRDGTLVDVTSGGDPELLASAVYACSLSGLTNGEFSLRAGNYRDNFTITLRSSELDPSQDDLA